MGTINLTVFEIDAIQADQKNQRRQSFGNPVEVFPPSFRDGWDIIQGVAAVYKPTAEQLTLLYKEREQRIEAWKQKASLTFIVSSPDADKVEKRTYAELAQRAYQIWYDRKGQPVAPKFLVNCCYRRIFALIASLMAFESEHGIDKVSSFTVPSKVFTWESEEARTCSRLDENRLAGRAGYSPVDLFGCAIDLVSWGHKPSSLQKRLGVKPGTKQKLHAWGTIANRYPELNLLERSLMAPPVEGEPTYTKGGYIRFGALDAKQARTLMGTAKEDALDDLVRAAVPLTAFGRFATADEIEHFLEVLHTDGKSNKPKIMDRATMETLRNSASSEIVRAVLDGVLAAAVTPIRDANALADKLTKEIEDLRKQIDDLTKKGTKKSAKKSTK